MEIVFDLSPYCSNSRSICNQSFCRNSRSSLESPFSYENRSNDDPLVPTGLLKSDRTLRSCSDNEAISYRRKIDQNNDQLLAQFESSRHNC